MKLDEEKLEIGDLVLHKGKRGWYDIDQSKEGPGIIMTGLYKKQKRKWVHKVWFGKLGKFQELGAGVLTKITEEMIYD